MGSFTMDASQWPLVIHTVEGTLDEAQLDDYVNQGTAFLLRREPHVVVIDLTGMTEFSAYARSRSAAWQKEYREELKQYCRGTVYVIRSPLLRFAAMTVLLTGRLPTPYRVCETREEALVWARERVASFM